MAHTARLLELTPDGRRPPPAEQEFGGQRSAALPSLKPVAEWLRNWDEPNLETPVFGDRSAGEFSQVQAGYSMQGQPPIVAQAPALKDIS
jgi:hypothetical protein